MSKIVHVIEEAFSSQKRPFNTSKHELILIVFYFCGSFLPSWIRIRIRIPNTDPDPQTRLNTDPDPGSGSTTLIHTYAFFAGRELSSELPPLFNILLFLLQRGNCSYITDWESFVTYRKQKNLTYPVNVAR
jgi:hypothetical protein